MGRRVWVVKKLNEKARRDAINAGCPEIAIGIPPRFADRGLKMPCAVEEPDPVILPIVPTLEERIAALEAKQ